MLAVVAAAARSGCGKDVVSALVVTKWVRVRVRVKEKVRARVRVKEGEGKGGCK